MVYLAAHSGVKPLAQGHSAGDDSSGMGETVAPGHREAGGLSRAWAALSLTALSLSLPAPALRRRGPVLVPGVRRISPHALLLRPGGRRAADPWPAFSVES